MTRSVFYNLASPEGEPRSRGCASSATASACTPSGPHVDLDERFDPVVAWHNPDPEYMTAPIDGAVNVMAPPWFDPETTAPTRTSTGATAARTSELARGAFQWLQLLDAPGDLGLRRRRRWARRCARCSTPSASAALEQLRADRIDLS